MTKLLSHISISPATLTDAKAILGIYASCVRDSSVSFEADPPSLAEMEARISANLCSHGYFVAKKAGVILGYAYGSQYRPRPAYNTTAEASVYLAPQAKGCGLARALYKVLLAHLAARGFHTVIGIVTTPNPASVRLHNACGFELVGTLREVGRKFDNWHGTAIYQRMIGDDETAA